MKHLRIPVFILLLMLIPLDFLYSWGFFAHKRINRLAVFTLPPEMEGFYKRNILYITEHAIDPDKRRYAGKDEAPRHFLDCDRYGDKPFENLPHLWNDAVAKFTEDSLKQHGILPWHINVMVMRLTN